MPYVSVHVDAGEVLEEMDDDDLAKEIARHEKRKAPTGCAPVDDDWLLERIWQHYRGKSDTPDCLREYIYRKLGRIIA